MPMDLERHEEILSSLNNPELSHEERANLLTELRGDYGQVLDEHAQHLKSIEGLEETNRDLLQANNKLFRDLGNREDPVPKTQEQQQQSLAETITLDDLLK